MQCHSLFIKKDWVFFSSKGAKGLNICWSQEVEFVLILFSFAAPGQEEALWHHVSRSLQAKFSRPEPIERVVCWLILINLQASPSFSHLYSSFFPSPTPSLPRWRHHQRRLKTATKSKLTTSQSQTSLCSLFSFPVFPKPVKYMVSQSRHFHARVWPSVGICFFNQMPSQVFGCFCQLF